MNTDDDVMLAERIAAIADRTDDSDWDEVVHLRDANGARPRRRTASVRLVALLAAVAALVFMALVAALAAALDVNLVPWHDAPKAPPPIVEDFASLDRGAPAGMESGVRAGETRREGQLAGHTLWVAPGKQAPFCFMWSDSFGGCVRQTWPAIQTSTEEVTSKNGSSRMVMVGGTVFADPTSRLALEYDDGTPTDLPVIWVGPPISAGFFYYNIPANLQPNALVLRDGGGHELGRETESFVPHFRPMRRVPPLPPSLGG
jgi:hypothetical protein